MSYTTLSVSFSSLHVLYTISVWKTELWALCRKDYLLSQWRSCWHSSVVVATPEKPRDWFMSPRSPQRIPTSIPWETVRWMALSLHPLSSLFSLLTQFRSLHRFHIPSHNPLSPHRFYVCILSVIFFIAQLYPLLQLYIGIARYCCNTLQFSAPSHCLSSLLLCEMIAASV